MRSTWARTLLAEPDVLLSAWARATRCGWKRGLCLYGHDIDEGTSPISAGLAWVIGKRRKLARDFPAAEKIMAELFAGTSRQRVGA
jgi:aminomethyltransferase